MDPTKNDLCTVKQLAARQPAFTEASLRYHIFMAQPRVTRQGVRLGNGLESALVRLGRKVLISESAFLVWVQRAGADHRGQNNGHR